MKKFLSFACLMCISVLSAFAGIINVPDVEYTSLAELDGKTFAIVNKAEEKALYGSNAQNLGYGAYEDAFVDTNSGYVWKTVYDAEAEAYYLQLVTPAGGDYNCWNMGGVLNSQGEPQGWACSFILGTNNQKGQDIPNGALYNLEYTENGWTIKNVGTGMYQPYSNGPANATEPTYWAFCSLKQVDDGKAPEVFEMPASLKNIIESGTPFYLKSGDQYLIGGEQQAVQMADWAEACKATNSTMYVLTENENGTGMLRAVTANGENVSAWGANPCYLNAQPTIGGVLFKMNKDQDIKNGSSWIIEEVEGGYTLQCLANKGYATTNCNTSAEPVVWEIYVPAEPIVTPALVSGEEEISLLAAASVENASGIVVDFENVIPATASYTISTMVMVEGEESSSWNVNETLAEGELSINGRGFVEFEEPMVFNQGEKYQLAITYTTMDPAAEPVVLTYEFNGATVVPFITSVEITSAGEAQAINSHVEASLESVEAIKVTFGNSVDVKEASYVISSMNEVVGEESTSYEIGATVAEGAISVNTIGYAELAEPVVLSQGTKYNVAIKVVYKDGSDESESFVVNGAYALPIDEDITVTLIAGDSLEYALNTHSNVTIDAPITAIKAQFGDINPMDSVSYAIYDKRETLASGLMSVNTIGYATFDAPINLYEGITYNVVLTVGSETYDYYVIGAMEAEEEPVIDEEVIVSLLANDSTEYTLNTHSNVTIDAPITAIKAQFGDMSPMDSVSYAIYDKRETLASGLMSVNTIGYATFDAPINLYEGITYNVVLTVGSETYDYYVIGAMEAEEEPVIDEEVIVSLLANDSTEYTLNTHSNVTVDAPITAIKAQFGDINPMDSVSYAIYDKRETLASGLMSVNTIGYATFDAPINLYEGITYNVVLTVGSETYDYYVIGAMEAEEEPVIDEEVIVSLLANDSTEYTLNTHSNVTIDAPITAIKAQFGDMSPMDSVSYAIYDKRETLASGLMSVNNIGYATFDAPINLYEGITYNVVLTVGSETYDYYVIGAMEAEEEPVIDEEIIVSLLANDSIEYTLNTHSFVSVDEPISAIKVQFGDMSPMEEVTYAIYSKAGTVAEGLLSVNNIGYAQFETPVSFESGVQYNVVIKIAGEQAAEFYFNGAAEPAEEEIAISGVWGTVAGDVLNISVAATGAEEGADLVVEGYIYGKNMEPMFFSCQDGDLDNGADVSIKNLEAGQNYTAEITSIKIGDVIGVDEETWTPVYEFEVSAAEGEKLYAIDFETADAPVEIAISGVWGTVAGDVLNISVAATGAEEGADLVVEGYIYGKNMEPQFFSCQDGDLENGADVSIKMLEAGQAYTAEITSIKIGDVIGVDEETWTPVYEFEVSAAEGEKLYAIDFETADAPAPSVIAEISVKDTIMNVVFPVGTDLGDNYAEKPYILTAAGEKIAIADYTTDNTTGSFFDPLNLIVITLTDKLAYGEYSLVIPAGAFIINGGDNNDEMVIPFTVGATGINGIATASKANGKYIENGKVVIVRNGIKYNTNGVAIK